MLNATPLTILFLSALSSTAALASPTPGTIDLGKFVAESNQMLDTTYGANQFEAGGELYFQDGAGSVGIPPLFDFSTLTYVRKPKFEVETQGMMVGYRLTMQGKLQIMNVFLYPEHQALGFSYTGTVFATFKEGTSLAQIKKITRELKDLFVKAEYNLMEAIQILQINAHPMELSAIIRQLKTYPDFSQLDLNHETYAYPIKFAPMIKLDSLSGKIDLDSLRTVTRELRNEGFPFSTETTIPAHLK